MVALGISRKWEDVTMVNPRDCPQEDLSTPAPLSLLLFTSGEASQHENHRDRGNKYKTFPS